MKLLSAKTGLFFVTIAALLLINSPVDAKSKPDKDIVLNSAPLSTVHRSTCRVANISERTLTVYITLFDSDGNADTFPVGIDILPGETERWYHEAINNAGNWCRVEYFGQPGEVSASLCSSRDGESNAPYSCVAF